MTDKTLAVRTDNALTNLTVRDMITLGQSLVGTGFLPNTIKTPEQAMAIMLKGQELRVPPMYSLSNIVIVNGKPSCSAELMLALIQRDYGQRAIRVKESTDDHCTVEYRQEGWDDIQAYTFTIQQAEQAGLFKNAVWKSYPAAMLRARCISAVARMAFPGSIGGMYVPGELGEAVTVNADGEVLSVSGVVANAVTGEIVDEPRNVRRLAPAPGEALDTLLMVAQEHGIPRDNLDGYARSKNIATIDMVPESSLRGLAERIASKPDDAREFFGRFAPPVETTGELFDADDLAALNADADRVQVAEKARA